MNVRLSEEGLKIVDSRRKRKGWNKQDKRWHTQANTCLTTLKRFQAQDSIRVENFIRLCKALDISDDDWYALVDWSD